MLEAPRPQYAMRNSTYAARSSPLAGPAIVLVSTSPIGDDKFTDDPTALVEKTRTGATPSRISTGHLTPPSSLRSVSTSRTPSPVSSRSASSDLSVVPPTLSVPPRARISSRARPSSAPVLPLSKLDRRPFLLPPPRLEPTPARPNTSPDPTRNWLTSTAPPPFSRKRNKGVVMPVRAPRPRTAPGAPEFHVARKAPVYGMPEPQQRPDFGMKQRRMVRTSTTSIGRASRTPNGELQWSTTPIQPRRKSLMSLSLPPGLGEVREEGEGEMDEELAKLQMRESAKLPLRDVRKRTVSAHETGKSRLRETGTRSLQDIPRAGTRIGDLPTLTVDPPAKEADGTRKWPWKTLNFSFLRTLVNKKVGKKCSA